MIQNLKILCCVVMHACYHSSTEAGEGGWFQVRGRCGVHNAFQAKVEIVLKNQNPIKDLIVPVFSILVSS